MRLFDPLKSFQSRFVQDAAKLTVGQGAAAGLALVAAPILGRIYSPADYGVVGAYMAVGSVVGSIASWNLQQAIVIEKDEHNVSSITFAAFGATAISTSISVLLVFLLLELPGLKLPDGQTNFWLYLLPATVASGGISATCTALGNRHQNYNLLAIVPVVGAVATVSLSIILGLEDFQSSGLMIAYFVGQFLMLSIYVQFYLRSPVSGAIPRIGRILEMANKHRRFTIWTMPTSFISQFAQQAPVYALSSFGGSLSMIGSLNRARSLLSMPVRLMGQSISQVFFRRASIDVAEKGNCKSIYLKTFLSLFSAGLPFFTLVAFIAPDLFEFVLGPNWREAGEIARILMPMLFLQLICSPLSTVFYIAGYQRADFMMTLCFAMITIGAVFSTLILGFSMIAAIYAFAICQSILYAGYIVGSFWITFKMAD